MKIRACQELFFFVSLVIGLGTLSPVWGDQTSATDASLAQLENRFFEHPYNQDTESDRLSRLEGFIFGSAQQGTVAERLKHIIATIPSEPEGSSASPKGSNIASSGNKQQSVSTNGVSKDLGALPDSSTYPRVTSLEQELLGRTYVGEALANRLARLETKAFGAASTSNDLSQRVDQLDQYSERHDLYGERRTATSSPKQPKNSGSYTSSGSSSQSEFSGSISERLAMMESQVFSHTYPERSLDKRVKKLEEKVFPDDKKRLADKPLPDQVDSLWLALHPNNNNAGIPLLGSSPASNRASDSYSYNSNNSNGNYSQEQNSNSGQYNGTSSASSNGATHHGWLHALAKTAGTVGKIAASSMSSYGGYPGYGYGGGGYGGYGGGYSGYGGGYGGYGNSSYFGAPSYYGNTLPYHY